MQPGQPDYHPIRFSSGQFPEHARVAAWRDFFGPTMFGADVELLGPHPYRQDIAVRRLPGVSLLSATNSPLRFTRTRAMLADGKGDFGLHLNSARALVQQRGRAIECAADEPILVTSAEAASMASPETARFRCLHVDRSELVQRVPHPEDSVLRRVPRDSRTLLYLRGYIRFLDAAQIPDQEPEIAHTAGRHIVDLIALLFGAAGDSAALARAGGLRAARMLSIKRQIRQSLGEPGFGVDHVAARHGISARSVQRLFEREGTTFSNYVLSQRINRACRMLGEPQHADKLVVEIAMTCGFGDLSYFNRCFRRAFGDTPTGVRAAAENAG